MAGSLTVGEFSRITHLSVKTLRHYHQVGLLEPAEDEDQWRTEIAWPIFRAT